jgi:DNA-directed RNA polymerase beta' subunit
VDLKTENVLKDKTVDDENGIQVFTNISFPAFSNTKDHVFYGVWNIAEAVAEVMVEKNKRTYVEVQQIRDLVLKRTAEITRELDDVERDRKAAEKLKREYEERLAKIQKVEQKYVNINV